MDKLEIEINKINLKIDEIELLLEKDYEEWTPKEIQKFGNHEQLRKKEEQLRDERKQLRDLLILKEKEKQGAGTKLSEGSILMKKETEGMVMKEC
jgi:hypothetical protein